VAHAADLCPQRRVEHGGLNEVRDVAQPEPLMQPDPRRRRVVFVGVGAAGCNHEDTDHATTTLRDPAQQAVWLRGVRGAASDQRYRLVINARIDVFLPSAFPGPGGRPGRPGARGPAPRAGIPRRRCRLRVPDRAVGGRCAGGLHSGVPGTGQRAPHPARSLPGGTRRLGVARVSYASLLHGGVMEQFSSVLASLAAEQGEHLRTG